MLSNQSGSDFVFLLQIGKNIKMDARVCLRNSDIFPSKYKIGRTIGHGGFGTVRSAEHVPTGHQVAIKMLNRKKIMNADGNTDLWEKGIFGFFFPPFCCSGIEVDRHLFTRMYSCS